MRPLIQYTSHSLVVTKNVISGTNLCSLFFLSYICIVHVYISQSISRCLVKMSYPVQIYALHFLAPYIYLSTVLAFRNNQKCHIQYKSMTLSCFFFHIQAKYTYISEYITHIYLNIYLIISYLLKMPYPVQLIDPNGNLMVLGVSMFQHIRLCTMDSCAEL